MNKFLAKKGNTDETTEVEDELEDGLEIFELKPYCDLAKKNKRSLKTQVKSLMMKREVSEHLLESMQQDKTGHKVGNWLERTTYLRSADKLDGNVLTSFNIKDWPLAQVLMSISKEIYAFNKQGLAIGYSKKYLLSMNPETKEPKDDNKGALTVE